MWVMDTNLNNVNFDEYQTILSLNIFFLVLDGHQIIFYFTEYLDSLKLRNQYHFCVC